MASNYLLHFIGNGVFLVAQLAIVLIVVSWPMCRSRWLLVGSCAVSLLGLMVSATATLLALNDLFEFLAYVIYVVWILAALSAALLLAFVIAMLVELASLYREVDTLRQLDPDAEL